MKCRNVIVVVNNYRLLSRTLATTNKIEFHHRYLFYYITSSLNEGGLLTTTLFGCYCFYQDIYRTATNNNREKHTSFIHISIIYLSRFRLLVLLLFLVAKMLFFLCFFMFRFDFELIENNNPTIIINIYM